jgi:hypothetical protein
MVRRFGADAALRCADLRSMNANLIIFATYLLGQVNILQHTNNDTLRSCDRKEALGFYQF